MCSLRTDIKSEGEREVEAPMPSGRVRGRHKRLQRRTVGDSLGKFTTSCAELAAIFQRPDLSQNTRLSKAQNNPHSMDRYSLWSVTPPGTVLRLVVANAIGWMEAVETECSVTRPSVHRRIVSRGFLPVNV